MKISKYIIYTLAIAVGLSSISCTDLIDEPLENEQATEATDYSIDPNGNMFLLLQGAYGELYNQGWEIYPTVAVRGDDADIGGKDDQPLMHNHDDYIYGSSYWFYNNTWNGLYTDVLVWHGAIEEIQKYVEAGGNATNAAQYIAETKVMQGFNLMNLARLWGNILIPTSSDPSDLFAVEVSSYADVMQYISDLMDEAIPNLPSVRPNQRTDIPGGVTRFTALAIKAKVNLELKNFQAVADATGEIISNGQFNLNEDYYNVFKIPGKLGDENLLELQYSDYGTPSGTENNYLNAFFGPPGNSYDPARTGAGGGWGFWEPSLKYIKFMLDRGETERLETTVIFTPAGMQELEADPNYANLPGWISNVTRDGDTFNNNVRMRFLSGKHYLPSVQLTPGRTNYGSNKNFICIRYSEVLLMHAEALTNGASNSAMTADAAVNTVRARVGLSGLTGVTLDDVLNEKFAEFGMEWGIRFADMIRYERFDELSYDGKTYNDGEDRYIPYPQAQVSILPQLKEATN